MADVSFVPYSPTPPLTPEEREEFLTVATEKFVAAAHSTESDEEFKKHHGGYAKDIYIANGFHQLREWNDYEKVSLVPIGSQLAEELVRNRIPHEAMHSALGASQKVYRFQSDEGGSPASYHDGYEFSRNRRLHGDLGELLSSKTLFESVVRQIYPVEGGHAQESDLRSKLSNTKRPEYDRLAFEAGVKQCVEQTPQDIAKIGKIEQNQPDWCEDLHYHFMGSNFKAEQAIELMSRKIGSAQRQDGFDFLWTRLGYVAETAVHNMGVEGALKFFTQPRSLEELRAIPSEERQRIALDFQARAPELAQGDLAALKAFLEALHGKDLADPRLSKALESAQQDPTPASRDRLALALFFSGHRFDHLTSSYRSNSATSLYNPRNEILNKLLAKADPKEFIEAFAKAAPNQTPIIGSLDFKWIADHWPKEQVAALVKTPGFAESAKRVVAEHPRWDRAAEKLKPILEPLSRSMGGFELGEFIHGIDQSEYKQLTRNLLYAAGDGPETQKNGVMRALLSHITNDVTRSASLRDFSSSVGDSHTLIKQWASAIATELPNAEAARDILAELSRSSGNDYAAVLTTKIQQLNPALAAQLAQHPR